MIRPTPRSTLTYPLFPSTTLFRSVHPLVELAPAGDRLELVGVQGIERDVHPLDAEAGQLLREAAELAAVGGEGELVQRAAVEVARERAEQLHDVAAHQRLAAGQAQLAHALEIGRAHV